MEENVKSLEIDGIGVIRVKKNLRGRTMRLSVNSSGEISLTVPGRLSMREAAAWVERKKPWMKKRLTALEQKKEKLTIYVPGIKYFTRFHVFSVQPAPVKYFRLQVNKSAGLLTYPQELEAASLPVQETVRKALARLWKIEAGQYLPGRVENLARQYGFYYRKLSIRNNRTRWGSCSSNGHLSLNLHLMRIPDHLIDYVILHELVHTVHKNHGKGFWESLSGLTGDARCLDRELKQHSLTVF